MEQTRNEDHAMRENMRQNTEDKIVQKSKTPVRLQKKMTTDNFEFVWAKNRYGDKKRGKEEGRKEERDGQKDERRK